MMAKVVTELASGNDGSWAGGNNSHGWYCGAVEDNYEFVNWEMSPIQK